MLPRSLSLAAIAVALICTPVNAQMGGKQMHLRCITGDDYAQVGMHTPGNRQTHIKNWVSEFTMPHPGDRVKLADDPTFKQYEAKLLELSRSVGEGKNRMGQGNLEEFATNLACWEIPHLGAPGVGAVGTEVTNVNYNRHTYHYLASRVPSDWHKDVQPAPGSRAQAPQQPPTRSPTPAAKAPVLTLEGTSDAELAARNREVERARMIVAQRDAEIRARQQALKIASDAEWKRQLDMIKERHRRTGAVTRQ